MQTEHLLAVFSEVDQNVYHLVLAAVYALGRQCGDF